MEGGRDNGCFENLVVSLSIHSITCVCPHTACALLKDKSVTYVVGCEGLPFSAHASEVLCLTDLKHTLHVL